MFAWVLGPLENMDMDIYFHQNAGKIMKFPEINFAKLQK